MSNFVLFGSTPLSLRPLAWWRFDDGSGTSAVDSSGRGYDLTLSNTPTWIAGQIGGGLNFAAANSQKGETSAPGLLAALQNLSELTITFWARAASYQAEGAGVAIRNGVDPSAVLAIYPFDTTDGNGVRVFHSGSPLINQDAAAASLDTWHHFAFTSRSSTNHEMFVNNISVGASSAEKVLPAEISHVTLGAWNGGQFFDGDIDDVMIFGRALTALELAAVYQWAG